MPFESSPDDPWQLPRRDKYSIEAREYGQERHLAIRLNARLGSEQPRDFRVIASSVKAIKLDPSQWGRPLVATVTRRLQDRGGRKGRVLYVVSDNRETGRRSIPLAALAWHRPESGPLCVLDVGVIAGIAGHRRDLLVETLFEVVREIAVHALLRRPADRLGWVTRSQPTLARAICEHGFRRRKKPGWCRRDQRYAERRF